VRWGARTWSLLYTLASALFWIPMAHWLNLIGPMMANDLPRIDKVTSITLGLLLIYIVASMYFFGWLLSRKRR